MFKVSEAKPGPPLLITQMVSNHFKASIVRNSKAMTNAGLRSGKVMNRNACQPLAPSMRADSYGSVGRADNPAKQMRVTKGVHCQMSTKTSAGMTVIGLFTHSIGGMPKRPKAQPITPVAGSYIMSQT